MSTGSRTLTTVSATPPTVAASGPPGTWTHPKLDEINRRLVATTFGDRQIKSIVWNTALILATIVVPKLQNLAWISYLRPLFQLTPELAWWLKWGLRSYGMFIICLAFLPLVYNKDDLSDIPLTPTQRSLLGLTPSSQPATPGSQYITPPRYSRSSTPRSTGSNQSASPYSPSPVGGFGGGVGSYSPSASPLYQKALGRDVTRRLSYGPASPLGLSSVTNQSSSSLTSNTPSPMPGRASSVSISNRWLYEKGRSSPGSLRNSLS